MPHLSPLNWIISPLIFWILLLSFSSILWWSQHPSFPKISSSMNLSSSTNWLW